MRKIATLFLLFCLLFGFNACKKEKHEDITPPLALWDNVKVIDTTNMVLDIVNSNFATGTLVYNNTTIDTGIHTGDVIIGTEGEGYIRKITGITQNGNTTTLQTVHGTMSDVFKGGNFSFNVDMNDMHPGKKSGFGYSLTNQTLYQSGAANIKLESANLDIDPNWKFDFTFDEGGINYFEMSTTNSPYTASARLKFMVAQSDTLFDHTDTLTRYSKTITKWVMVGLVPVPVVVTLKFYWIAEYSLIGTTAISNVTDFSSAGTVTAGMRYQNGQWQGLHNFNVANNLDVSQPVANVALYANLALRPVVTAKLYGVAGPHASVAAMCDFTGVVATPNLDWDLTANAWLQASLGADVTILGNTIASMPEQEWQSPKKTFHKPDRIEKISGDNQQGSAGQMLSDSVKVRVLDSQGEGVKSVPVYFTTTSGSTSAATVTTDANGYAAVQWQLGSQQGSHTLRVSAKKANQEQITSSPVTFTATATSHTGGCVATVTDIDGNVYNVVQVGNQCWMSENLKTTRFNNGAGIAEVEDSLAWVAVYYGANATPAWCYYDNNASLNGTYGKLYNWYAATDNRNICPTGWHVPTNTDWDEFVTAAGGEPTAGDALKTVTLWSAPNSGTNTTGWSAVPGGGRTPAGSFSDDFGTYGTWWSATEYASDKAYHRMALNTQSTFMLVYNNKYFGHAVRCVKD